MKQIFLFYWILAPGLAAYRRNVSFRGMKFARHLDDDGVFGALFSGRVIRVGRIMQNREYNRPETFVMSVEDEQWRKLRVRKLFNNLLVDQSIMRCARLISDF